MTFGTDPISDLGHFAAGVLYGAGGSGGIFAPAKRAAMHSAHLYGNGGRHHAGGECLEPFAPGY